MNAPESEAIGRRRIPAWLPPVEHPSFHRIRRESLWLTIFGLSVAGLLAFAFLGVGFVGIEKEDFDSVRTIFGLFGIGLFIFFLRAGWVAASGRRTHVFSVDESEIEWGFWGSERRLPMSEVREFYWNDTEGLTLIATCHDGKKVRFANIDFVIRKHEDREKLLSFLGKTFPHIPIT